MPRMQINDISMYYETHGAGVPVVFIAGFSADHTTWDEVLGFFKDQYQVIVFDNRGAGQTDIPDGPYTIEQMADDVASLCAQLGINRAHFVGNSMGGFITQMLAYKYPQLARSVVIGNSSTNIEAAFSHSLVAQLELLEAKVPIKPLLLASYSWAFSYKYLAQPGRIEQLMKMDLEDPYPFTIKGFKAQHEALKSFNSAQWLSKISTPALILGSDEDLIFLEREAKFIAKHIAGSEYHCFEQCGHIPALEYPKNFAEVIKRFIADKK
jgi:pimeloyl-ACP methyl ester carboxylesterase